MRRWQITLRIVQQMDWLRRWAFWIMMVPDPRWIPHQINTCGSTFNTVSQVYTKYAKGYTVTGVGGVNCARHGFKRPNSVVDLQRGKRWVSQSSLLLHYWLNNQIFQYGLRAYVKPSPIFGHWDLLDPRLVQHHVSVAQKLPVMTNKLQHLPPLQVLTLKYWRVAIPKFHLPGHRTDCQLSYNLVYIKWAGQTDGEHIEAGWAQTSPIATWTQESGPNACRGILDDHWNAGNWWKLLGLHEFLIFSLLQNLTIGIRGIPQ